MWCGADERCYPRSQPVSCTSNLQTASCPGVCPLLTTCSACTLSSCTWCPSTRTCRSFDADSCPDDGHASAAGVGSLLGVTDVIRCGQTAALGLTYTLYRPPADFKRPDVVGISNGSVLHLDSSLDEFRGAREAQDKNVGYDVGRLTGFLLPEVSDMSLKLQAEHLNASLVVDNDHFQNVTAFREPSRTSPKELKFPDAPGSVHRIRMQGRSKGTMSLMWSGDNVASVHVTRNELRIYRSGQNCSGAINCLACVTDSACGWCQVASDNRGACMRNDEPCIPDGHPSSLEDKRSTYFHALIPSECPTCLQHIYCNDCTSDNDCEWLPDTAHCTRRGRFKSLAVTSPETCPPACHTRTSCTQCLGTKGRCAWCQHTKVG